MATASHITNPDMSPSSIDNSGASSPGSQSRGATKAVSSAWTQVVRGESESIASVPLSTTSVSPSSSPQSTAVIEPPAEEESGLDCGNGNAGGGKRPAWNKPSNGAVEVGPVMGAHLWPALSETTRGSSSTKSSSDSLKGLADGSASSVSQGTGTANSPSQKHVSNNGNSNLTPNNTVPTRQRSMKRNGANTSSNGSLPQTPAPQGPVVEGTLNNPSPRDHSQKGGFGSQSHSGNDHPHRGSFKSRSGRGDGSHHHNYGRRDQDRGNQDWNHRNFSGRDAHMQTQRGLQRFIRHPPPPPPPPPPSSAPFIPPPPPPVRPFGSPIGFHEFASPVYYVAAPPPEALRGVPFVTPIPPHALFFPALDPQLHSRIVSQIDYYFSNENLIKDTYLRQNMDEQGWVSIKLIAGFKKVSLLTDNIQLILDAVRSSTVVEVQGDKIRKRNDWMRWIIPPGQYSNISSPGKSNADMLAAHVQGISLEQKTADNAMSRSSSGDLSNQSSAGAGQVQGGRTTN